MTTNLNNFGNEYIKKVYIRELISAEDTIANPNGLTLKTINLNPVNIISDLTLDIESKDEIFLETINNNQDINLLTSGSNSNIVLTATNNFSLTSSNLNVSSGNIYLDTKNLTGAVYLNQISPGVDASGDFRLRIDTNNDLLFEYYNGASWIKKMKLTE